MRIAVVGVGRIGQMHALHAQEVAKEIAGCELTAVVDINVARADETAQRLSASQSTPVRAFYSAEEFAAAGVADGSIISTPTDCHQSVTSTLIEAGQRVLLEKPLTMNLEDDRKFAKLLNEKYPNAVMLAFQRRYDEPLQHAKRLMEQGAVGRVFKIVSALEDSNPAPDGYTSGGILPDMSVHNVDEILWICGKVPVRAASIGSCLYSRKLSTAVEDFDDAYMHLWFEGEFGAQVQVSRNHVSGYRVETWIFGEEGQIHVGRFDQRHRDIAVEVYGRRDRKEPIEQKVYPMRDYGRVLPEFVDRFGPAYKAEVIEFVGRCQSNAPFSVTHNDGVRAMEVIDAAMRGVFDSASGAEVQRNG